MDLGTGDGRSVLYAARHDANAFFIGLDADAASMRDASRRAARPAKKGGVPNAVFIEAGVGSMPDDLDGVADDVRITFPWGSLLSGVLGADGLVLDGIARIAKLGTEIRALVSLTERDRLGVSIDVDPGAYEASGLRLLEVRSATRAEISETNSTWAKRLRAGVDRPVTLLHWTRV